MPTLIEVLNRIVCQPKKIEKKISQKKKKSSKSGLTSSQKRSIMDYPNGKRHIN